MSKPGRPSESYDQAGFNVPLLCALAWRDTWQGGSID